MTVIAVFNRKGGAGRTTLALNLLAAIARRGERPLGLDLDPQAHLSEVFGAHVARAEDSVFGFFAREVPLDHLAQITKSGVLLCPAHPDLAKLDAILGKGIDALLHLQRALHRPVATGGAVVIDCGALLNIVTLNALLASDVVVVPVASDFLSLQAALHVERALNALEPVARRRLARRYVLTRYDPARAMCQSVALGLESVIGARDRCTTRIGESVAIAESPTLGLDVFRHAPESAGAQDFATLAEELLGSGPAR
jgi:chromosome partitioning protein